MSNQWAKKFRLSLHMRSALRRSMKPTPGSQIEKDQRAGKYVHVTYPLKG